MKWVAKIVRIFAWVAAFTAVAAIAYVYLKADAVSKPTYVTATVNKGKLRDTVTATGSVNAVVTVEVGSQLSGQLSELLVDYNDTVTKGQAVARLNKESYEARRAEAHAFLEMAKANVAIKEAELDRIKADLRDTQSNLPILEARRDGAAAKFDASDANLKRIEGLVKKGVVSSGELEVVTAEQKVSAAALHEAEALLKTHAIRVAAAAASVARQVADLTNARASILQNEAVLQLADVELERTVIRSPIDGVVIKRNVSEGQTVAASLEAPTLFTIAQDLSEMELHARVDETDIGKVRLGQTSRFSVDAFPGRVFAGTVTQIRKSPEVIQNVVTYIVVITTSNDELLLLPGMTAVIQILIMEIEDVVKIPSAALSFRPSWITPHDMRSSATAEASAIVWMLGKDDQPQPVQITTGLSDRSSIVVVSGDIKVGDEVITTEIDAPPRQKFLGIRIGF